MEKHSYDNYKCTQTLQNIDWSTVDALIYSSSKDSDVDAILELSKAGEIVKKIIYVNSSLNALFYGLFTGVNADVYNDENMLDDESILDFLVDSYHETGMTVKSVNADVETIAKFIASVSKESAESLDKMLRNPILLKTLESSVQSVEHSLIRTDEANGDMVKMFNKTSDMIQVLKDGQAKTTAEIEKLGRYLDDIENRKGSSTGIMIYPTFTVPNTVKKVLYIEVYSPCQFLNSFILAYRDYLRQAKQVNSKLMFVVPKLKKYITKYSELTRLDAETLAIRNISSNDVFVTFEPKSQVLDAFFSYKADIHIVVDMLYSEPLLKGAKLINLSAVSSLNDIKRFGLKGSSCILSSQGTATNIVIPKITNYLVTQGRNQKTEKATEVTKKHKYFQACTNSEGTGAYNKLDRLLAL